MVTYLSGCDDFFERLSSICRRASLWNVEVVGVEEREVRLHLGQGEVVVDDVPHNAGDPDAVTSGLHLRKTKTGQPLPTKTISFFLFTHNRQVPYSNLDSPGLT